MPSAASSRVQVFGVPPPAPPKRRWLPKILVLLVLLAAIVYALLPRLACWWLAGQLPWRVQFPAGGLVVAGVACDAAAVSPVPELQVTVAPARARALAGAASGWWLPPWLARSGQHAEGSLILPILRLQPFAWQVAAGGIDDAPLACLRVRSSDLDRFLAEEAVSVVEVGERQVLSCRYEVDAGRIEDDEPPRPLAMSRRQRVVARGRIVLDAGGFHRVVEVHRLAGHAVTTFTVVPAGLRLSITVAIEESDAELISLPLVGDVRPLLLKQLEIAANRGLKDGLDKVILPEWFPTDTRVDVEVVETPGSHPFVPPAPVPAAPSSSGPL